MLIHLYPKSKSLQTYITRSKALPIFASLFEGLCLIESTNRKFSAPTSTAEGPLINLLISLWNAFNIPKFCLLHQMPFGFDVF